MLRAADADCPERVTQRDYDAARATAGYSDSPRAAKLAARFGVSWTRFTKIIITEQYPAQVLAQADYTRVRKWRTETEIVSAIRTAAAWLGTDHINQASYERARLELNAVAAKRHLHGRGATPLPSIAVIRFRLSFAEAVTAAGLRITPPRHKPPMPRADVIVLFIEHCGFVPGQDRLKKFASYHRIRLADRTADPHTPALQAARDHFERLGRPLPPQRRETPPADWEARIHRDSPALRAASAAYPATRKQGYTEDDLRDSIRAAFALLRPGETLTGDRYKALQEQHPPLLLLSQITRTAKRNGTGWGELVRQVTAERAAALRSLPHE